MNKLELIPLNNIKIDDPFWGKYTRLVTEAIIPYQWDILNDRIPDIEPSHCINNFRIVAKEVEGDYQGAVFQDTDLAKWMEAVAYSLAYEKNEKLEAEFDKAVDLLEKVQWEDGYINTYYTVTAPELRFTNLQEGHELYTAGHFLEAAVAYYKVTGKDKLLNIMKRFADLLSDIFTSDKYGHAYPGHQEIELALVKLYEVTNEMRYLALAKRFIDNRGVGLNYFFEEEKRPEFRRIFPEFNNYLPLYSQSHLPVVEQETAEGHSVRAVYMYCAMADIAYEYNDKVMLNTCVKLWDNIVTRRMFLTGGIGSSGILERFTTDYDLPNDDNYSETCASIGLALFGRRMARITQESRYMDIVEKSLYNVVLAGIAMDGKSFFYVNPLEVWPDNCLPRTSKEHVKAERQKWFGVACCPPNIARTLASLGEYIYMSNDSCLFINLFISNETVVIIGDQNIHVSISTEYPYSGEIEISVASEEPILAKLAIRIPEYVQEYTIFKDGNGLDNLTLEKGYIYIDNLQKDTKIKVRFNIEARFVYANPKVRENAGKVAIMKGPLVYCLEEVDNCENLGSVFVDAKSKLIETMMTSELGTYTSIQLEGSQLVQNIWSDKELYSGKEPEYNSLQLTAVPYPYWGNRKTGEMMVWMKYKD